MKSHLSCASLKRPSTQKKTHNFRTAANALENWGVDPAEQQTDDMDHGDGMIDEDDLPTLEASNGTEASRLFL